MQVVIMAGGQGERLKSVFPHTPKTLVPVGGVPLLTQILEKLVSQNVTEVIICAGPFSNLIQAFINNHFLPLKIVVIGEKFPLGTAGPLSLIKERLRENFIVMNGDLLMDFDFHSLMSSHLNNHAIVTSVFTKVEQSLRYGVLELDEDNSIQEIVEKPSWKIPVLVGIYAMNKKVVEDNSLNRRIDMPDFLQELIGKQGKVMGFEHAGDWMDIGTPEDYLNLNRKVNSDENHRSYLSGLQ